MFWKKNGTRCFGRGMGHRGGEVCVGGGGGGGGGLELNLEGWNSWP